MGDGDRDAAAVRTSEAWKGILFRRRQFGERFTVSWTKEGAPEEIFSAIQAEKK